MKLKGNKFTDEEAEFIAKFASKITIIHQFDKLQANKEAQEKAFANPKIKFVLDTEPRGFERVGDKIRVATENLKTKIQQTLEADGVFAVGDVRSKKYRQITTAVTRELDNY
jgi:thioredoxin reductase (NADPH)